VATPGFETPKGIRALKLLNFLKVMIGAAWTGKLSAIAQQFLAEIEREATSLRKAGLPPFDALVLLRKLALPGRP
jgi:hypothetical protein